MGCKMPSSSALQIISHLTFEKICKTCFVWLFGRDYTCLVSSTKTKKKQLRTETRKANSNMHTLEIAFNVAIAFSHPNS